MTEDDFRAHVARLVEETCGSAGALARKHKIHPKSLTLFLSGVRGPSPEVAAAFGYRREYVSLAAHSGVPSEGMREIAAERRRLVEAEGWTPEHDDEHGNGELSAAALGYIQSALGELGKPTFSLTSPPAFWPWDEAWWKPRGARRDLIRAAALIAAEIERIDRAALRTDPAGGEPRG